MQHVLVMVKHGAEIPVVDDAVASWTSI